MADSRIDKMVTQILQFIEADYRTELGELLAEDPQLEMWLMKVLDQWRPGIAEILQRGALPTVINGQGQTGITTVEDIVKQLNQTRRDIA